MRSGNHTHTSRGQSLLTSRSCHTARLALTSAPTAGAWCECSSSIFWFSCWNTRKEHVRLTANGCGYGYDTHRPPLPLAASTADQLPSCDRAAVLSAPPPTMAWVRVKGPSWTPQHTAGHPNTTLFPHQHGYPGRQHRLRLPYGPLLLIVGLLAPHSLACLAALAVT